VLIFFTTIVFGATIPYLQKYYNVKENRDDDYQALETSYDQKMLQSTGTYDYDTNLFGKT
jgi:hypothetical protein